MRVSHSVVTRALGRSPRRGRSRRPVLRAPLLKDPCHDLCILLAQRSAASAPVDGRCRLPTGSKVDDMSGLRSRSSRVRLATAIALGLFEMVVTAAPASAHSGLESTTPQQGSQVSTAPSSVSLTFSEGVGLRDDSVQVLDSQSRRMDKGDAHHPAGQPSTVVVDLKAGMPKASYVVVWRVVTSDSHPIEGTSRSGSAPWTGCSAGSRTRVPCSCWVGPLSWCCYGRAE